jgi:hypothetical protein
MVSEDNMIYDKILVQLQALGTDKDEVAASLEVMGITGELCSAGRCPIANYVNKNNPGLFGFMINMGCMYYGNYVEHDIPLAVKSFILAFDNKAYPKLIDLWS